MTAFATSCIHPNTPRGPFPKSFNAKVPLHVYCERRAGGDLFWIDSAKGRFLPHSNFSEVAFLAPGTSVRIMRVWAPVELLPPGDFKIRCQIDDESKLMDITTWLMAEEFNCYFIES